MKSQDNTPTYKQLNLIKELEAEFGEKFTGTTKKDASVYIDKWLTIARNDVENYNWYNESING